MKPFIYLLLLTAVLTSCQPSMPQSVEELQEYVANPEHGLSQKLSFENGVEATATWRPTALLVQQEGDNLSAEELSKAREKYGSYLYFVLSFSANGKEVLKQTGGNFAEVLQTLSFRMGEYASLYDSEGNEIPLADAVFSRTYGMGSATSVLLAFKRPDLNSQEYLKLQIREFGLGTGKLRFRFEKGDWQAVASATAQPPLYYGQPAATAQPPLYYGQPAAMFSHCSTARSHCGYVQCCKYAVRWFNQYREIQYHSSIQLI